MGKGDKKTRKGKIIMGSYGVKRPHNKTTPSAAKAFVKKDAVKSTSGTKPKAPKKAKEE